MDILCHSYHPSSPKDALDTIVSLGFDFDGFEHPEDLKGLITDMVNIAKEGLQTETETTMTATTISPADEIESTVHSLFQEIEKHGIFLLTDKDKFKKWNPNKEQGYIALCRSGILLVSHANTYCQSLSFLPWGDYAVTWSFKKERIWKVQRKN